MSGLGKSDNAALGVIDRFSALPYDVIVVGGGVNGAGVARDASGRGARVLLLEQGDLARGTSSASTKLIHGGLRYLEHYEFGLVREALKEREILWSIAPHIIWPLRFVLPYRTGLRPRWLLRLGLFLYDHIGGRKKLPATRSVDLKRHEAGDPLQPQYVKAFEYSDGWVDDARLVLLNARDAADKGARVKTHTRAETLRVEDGLWVVEGNDDRGHSYRFTGKSLVNAAGPAVLDLLARASAPPDYKMRLVRGSHIVVRKKFEHDYAYFFQLPDGRIFFAIPYERDFTLIGTTDLDHDGSLEDVHASADEIAYLCEGASLYFQAPVTPADVVWTYSGVRPLIEDGSGKPEAATRGYRIDLDTDEGAPLLTIYGGKITSYRHVAEHAVDKLAEHLDALSGKHWTA
ncbi:MAG: glycerol-3-phosphate dehydrogenase, partial [Sphingopyxis sp.]|nr:glycerol-3-phosphate dehydrogenase [Sphingopyxis sp.]